MTRQRIEGIDVSEVKPKKGKDRLMVGLAVAILGALQAFYHPDHDDIAKKVDRLASKIDTVSTSVSSLGTDLRLLQQSQVTTAAQQSAVTSDHESRLRFLEHESGTRQ